MGIYLSIFPLPKPVTGIDHFRPSFDDRTEREFASDLAKVYETWATRKGIECVLVESVFDVSESSWNGSCYSTVPKAVLFFPSMPNISLKGEEGVHGVKRMSCFTQRFFKNSFVGITVAQDVSSFREFDITKDLVRFHYVRCPNNWTAVYRDGKLQEQTYKLLLETYDLDTFLENNNV